MPPDLGLYVGVIDDQFRWLAVSPGFAALVGYRIVELVGQPSTMTADAPDPATIRRNQRELLATGERSGVAVLLARDGTRIPFAYSFRAVEGSSALYVMCGRPWPQLDPSERRGHAGWDPDDWLEKSEAADHAGKSVRTIERAIAAYDRGEPGGLKATGRHGRRLIQFKDLNAWLLGLLLALITACLLIHGHHCPIHHLFEELLEPARV